MRSKLPSLALPNPSALDFIKSNTALNSFEQREDRSRRQEREDFDFTERRKTVAREERKQKILAAAAEAAGNAPDKETRSSAYSMAAQMLSSEGYGGDAFQALDQVFRAADRQESRDWQTTDRQQTRDWQTEDYDTRRGDQREDMQTRRGWQEDDYAKRRGDQVEDRQQTRDWQTEDRDTQREDQAEYNVLKLAASGDAASAKAVADKFGLKIPPQIIQNADTAKAFVQAREMYPNQQQAAQYIQAYLHYRKQGDQDPESKARAAVGQPKSTGGKADRYLSDYNRALDAAKKFADAQPGAFTYQPPDPNDPYGRPQKVKTPAWHAAYDREVNRLTGRAPRGGADPEQAPIPQAPNVSDMFSKGPQHLDWQQHPQAVAALKANPDKAAEFDEKFGPGAAADALRDMIGG